MIKIIKLLYKNIFKDQKLKIIIEQKNMKMKKKKKNH